MNLFLIVASLLLLIIIPVHFSRNKRAKNKVVYVIDNNCTGCQRCVKRCRRKALDITNDKSGLHVALKHPEKCTACGDCVAVCKFKALELTYRK